MTFETSNAANIVLKRVQGKSHTGVAKELSNEAIPSDIQLSMGSIMATPIPSTPPGADTASIIVCTGANELDLTLDPSSNGDAYFVEVPTGHELLNHINPGTGVAYQVGDRVQYIIPDKFGADYRPILKDNGVEVAPSASNDWLIDTRAGVVVSEDDLSLGSTGTLECYVYVGGFGSGHEKEIHISPSGGDGASVKDTIDGISDAASDNRYLVIAHPGVYNEQVTGKEWVFLKILPGAKITHNGAVGDNYATYFPAPNSIVFGGGTIEGTDVDSMAVGDVGHGISGETVFYDIELLSDRDLAFFRDSTDLTVNFFNCRSPSIGYDGFNILTTTNGETITMNIIGGVFHGYSGTTEDINGIFRSNPVLGGMGEMNVFGVTVTGDYTDPTANVVIAGTTSNINLYNVKIKATAATSGNIYGVRSVTGTVNGDMRVYSGSVEVSNSGAGDAFDLSQSGSGVLSVSPAAIFSTSEGTLTALTCGPINTNGNSIAVGAITNAGNILTTSNNKHLFRDVALQIFSSTDGQLDIVADGTLALSAPITTFDGDIHLDVDERVVFDADASADSYLTYNSANSQLDLFVDNNEVFNANGTGVNFVKGIGLGDAGASTARFINVSGITTSTMSEIIGGAVTYTGTAISQVGTNITLTGQGTFGTQAVRAGQFTSTIDTSDSITGTMTANGVKGLTGFDSGEAISKGTYNMYAVEGGWGNAGGSHTGGTIRRASIYGQAVPALTGSATEINWAGLFGGDVQLFSDSKLILEGSATAKGDTYFTYDSTGTTLDCFVDGTEAWNASSSALNLIADTVSLSPSSDLNMSGNITLETSPTIGTGAAGVDYSLTFNGETNDGSITWQEDEDYFRFADDILMNGTEKLYLDSTDQYLYAVDSSNVQLRAATGIAFNISTAQVAQFTDSVATIRPSSSLKFSPGGDIQARFQSKELRMFTTANEIGTDYVSLGWSTSGVMAFGVAGNEKMRLTATTLEFEQSAKVDFTMNFATTGELICNGTFEAPNLRASNLTSGRVLFASTGGLLAGDGDMTFAVDTLNVTKVAVKAGDSTGNIAKVGGVAYSKTSTTNNTGTGESALYGQSIAASALSADGQRIRFRYAGTIQSSANNKQLRVKFGSTTFFDSGAANPAATEAFVIEGTITRIGATSQKCEARMTTGSMTVFNFAGYATAAETLSGAVTLLFTGQGGASTEITFETGVVEWLSAP